MCSTSMWTITIRSAIIRARAISCSFHRRAQKAKLMARCSVVNGLAGCSNTIGERAHECFDHTGSPNLTWGQRGEWQERLLVETVLSMRTLVSHVQKVMPRGWAFFHPGSRA